MIAAVASNCHIAQATGRDSGVCCNLDTVGVSITRNVAGAAIASDQHIATVGGDSTTARHENAFIISGLA